MILSAHFTLEELTRSDLAMRKGLDNTPNATIVENLKQTALGLERVRELLGNVPMHISSGYRSPNVNAALGGSKTSQHMTGEAADFEAPAFGTPREVCKEIAASDIPFDQLIFEGSWAHISFAYPPRRSILTAHFSNGKATYTQGIA